MLRKMLIPLAALLLVLNGCATVTPAKPAPQNQKMTWDNRVQTLSGIEDWDLHALIAIRNNKDDASANLRWQQKQKTYTLDIFGPMGASGYKLTGAPGKVRLQNARGQVFYATSPETLLAQQTGWQLPVSNLYYWIRGLPVPNLPATKKFDAFHHLTELDQDGFHLQYLRYSLAGGIDLPTKIFLSSSAITVKIIINQWQL